MKIKFFIKSRREGQNSILVRVRNGRKTDLSCKTGLFCQLEDWDDNLGYLKEVYYQERNGKQVLKMARETKRKVSRNQKINLQLREMSDMIQSEYLKDINRNFDSEWLRNLLHPEPEVVEQEMTLLRYFDIYVDEKRSLSKSALKKLKTVKNKVKELLESQGRVDVKLKDVNARFKNDFIDFADKKGYSINYREKNFKFIKGVLFHAEQNGHEICKSIYHLKAQTEKTHFEILTPDDLKLIEAVQLEAKHLQIARDWLLISCYTGQRISDFMNFKKEMISEKIVNEEKRFFISFVQQKTGKQVYFPLDSKVIRILERYGGDFPVKMNAVNYNKHIKEVARLAGLTKLVVGAKRVKIKITGAKSKYRQYDHRKKVGKYPKYELISSHIGRRSFASNNYGIIPTPLIMTVTGHSSSKMLMQYIGKIDERQSLQLADYIK